MQVLVGGVEESWADLASINATDEASRGVVGGDAAKGGAESGGGTVDDDELTGADGRAKGEILDAM